MDNTHAFFTDFLDFIPEKFHEGTVSWIPPLSEFIAFDPKYKLYSMPAGLLEEDARNVFLEHLNGSSLNIIGSEEKERYFFKLIKDQDDGAISINVSQKDLDFITQNVKNPGSIGRLTLILDNYYNDNFFDHEVKQLLKDAFNLPWNKKGWGPARGFETGEILYGNDDGSEIEDHTVYLGQHGFLDRMDLLEADILQTVGAVLTFLKGSGFLSEEQDEALDDISPEILMRVPSKQNPERYRLAFNMNMARRLQEVGVTIDLSHVADFHFERRYEGRKDWTDYISSEHFSAAKALTKTFNLATLIDERGDISHDGQTLMRFSGYSNDGGCFSGKTGLPINRETGEDISFSLSFAVGIRFDALNSKQVASFGQELEQELGQFLHENGFEGEDFTVTTEKESISLQYSLIDTMLRNNLIFDAQPLVEKHVLGTGKDIDRLNMVLASFEKTAGIPFSTLSLRPEKLLKHNPDKFGKEISLRFEQEFRTSEADYPHPISIYNKEADAIANILQENNLSQYMKAKSSAVRWAGGLTGHFLDLKIDLSSIDEAEERAALFAPLKDQIRPVLQSAICKSMMKSFFDERMFGFPETGTPEFEEYCHFLYVAPIAEIESLLQGKSQEHIDQDAYDQARKQAGTTIDYLVKAEQHPKNQQIREIAACHLKKMGERVPLMVDLIAQSRQQFQSLSLEDEISKQELLPQGPS